ncbi:hypothetical protein M011DRAFT_303081 [Sporormia fimetaria CBS 119925]|uniref:Uncharacterized protein n=1 Tax=Sporormia fimetaria CBS 119925 TaxID=1340428 RepID=A0A6A6VHI8_9PLEO|nr:hypothetical protein M011DRAFT_303081 [Sporormia fimetaria CBS 119925]
MIPLGTTKYDHALTAISRRHLDLCREVPTPAGHHPRAHRLDHGASFDGIESAGLLACHEGWSNEIRRRMRDMATVGIWSLLELGAENCAITRLIRRKDAFNWGWILLLNGDQVPPQ